MTEEGLLLVTLSFSRMEEGRMLCALTCNKGKDPFGARGSCSSDVAKVEGCNLWGVDPGDRLPREAEEEHVGINGSHANVRGSRIVHGHADGEGDHRSGHRDGAEHEDLPSTILLHQPDRGQGPEPESEGVEAG